MQEMGRGREERKGRGREMREEGREGERGMDGTGKEGMEPNRLWHPVNSIPVENLIPASLQGEAPKEDCTKA